MTDEYSRMKKIIDDYFRLVNKTLTGRGDVPEHVLKKAEARCKED